MKTKACLVALLLASTFAGCVPLEAEPPPAAGPAAPPAAPPPPAGAAAAPPPTAPATSASGSAAGIQFVERVTGGASASRPLVMVVALHGRGGDSQQLFDGFFGSFAEP